jgi:actin-related protein 8
MLDDMCFKDLFLHKESVTACIGAGMGSAMVVDVGATKTSVTCVLEGNVMGLCYIVALLWF